MYCFQKTHLTSNNKSGLKLAGQKKILHANINQMRAREITNRYNVF